MLSYGAPPWHSRGGIVSPHRHRRIWVDLLRGAALVGMIAYHAAWDLHAFGMSAVDPGADPGWRWLGRGVATVFLALSGFSLSLAIAQGRSGRAMMGRLVRIAIAAALVSAATLVLSPRTPIWFGILHCIVVTNMIAIALRSMPSALLLGTAAAALAAPSALSGIVGSGWAWTGLAATEPATLDFRPVLPWLAPVLAGMVLGRSAMSRWSDLRALMARPLRPLASAGRHSLAIYLIHQPVLFAALLVLSHGGVGRDAPAEILRDPKQASAFLRQCRSHCSTTGGDEALCRSTCHCVLTALARPAGAAERMRAGAGIDLDAAVAACKRDPGG